MILLQNTTHWSEILKNIAESIGLLIGGAWVYWRFFLNRENESKIELDLDIRVIGLSNVGEYIVELTASMTNKGLVRHYIKDFTFDLLYLSSSDELTKGTELIDKQLKYPHNVVKGQPWVTKGWYQAFVDAGVTRRFTYMTYLPMEAISAVFITRFNQLLVRKSFRQDDIQIEGEETQLRAHAQNSIMLQKLNL